MWFDHNQNSLTIQHLQNLQNNATGLYHDWMDRVAQYNVRLKTRQKEGVTSATTRPEHRRPSMCLFSLPSLGFQTFSTYAELFLTKSLYMTTHLLTFLQNIYMFKRLYGKRACRRIDKILYIGGVIGSYGYFALSYRLGERTETH